MMIATVVFCIAVTVLCCYTVHMLLEERRQTQTEIFKAMAEIDQIALNRPLPIHTHKSKHARTTTKAKNGNHTIIDAEYVDVTHTSTINKLVDNFYPILPLSKVSIGNSFDIRA